MRNSKTRRWAGHGVVACAGLVLTFIAAAPAVAGPKVIGNLQTAIPKEIQVPSYGGSYKSPAPAAARIEGNAYVWIDTKGRGSIESWNAYIYAKPKYGAERHFPEHGLKTEYRGGGGPETLQDLVPVELPASAVAPLAAEQCNAMADELRSQGWSEHDIFKTDRWLPLEIDARVDAAFADTEGRPDPQQNLHHLVVKITCKRDHAIDEVAERQPKFGQHLKGRRQAN